MRHIFRYTEVDGRIWVPHLDGTYARLFGSRVGAERFAHTHPPPPRNPFEYLGLGAFCDAYSPWRVSVDALCRRALEIDPTPISESERYLLDFWSAWLELHSEGHNLLDRLRLCRHLGVLPIPHRMREYPFLHDPFDPRDCWFEESYLRIGSHRTSDEDFESALKMLSLPVDIGWTWWEQYAETLSDDVREFLYWLRHPFPYEIVEVALDEAR